MSFYQIGLWTAAAFAEGMSTNAFAVIMHKDIALVDAKGFCAGWSAYHGY